MANTQCKSEGGAVSEAALVMQHHAENESRFNHTNASGAHWHAVYTMSRHEKRVAQDLAQRQVDSFVPTYRTVHRWKDRKKELDLALFPGYVFVHAERKDRLRILQVPSVVNIVSFDGQPAVIPDAEIEAIRRGIENKMRLKPHPYLKVGRRVRIHSGPMAGQEGILIRRKEGYRVVLSIDFIMRSVAVEVDESDIEPLT